MFLTCFIAFAVISGFTLNAYRLTYGFQGSGIYSDTNTFSLNGNTVILFVFVLATAYVVSAIYFFLARMFTKVPNTQRMSSDGSNSFGLPQYYIVFWDLAPP